MEGLSKGERLLIFSRSMLIVYGPAKDRGYSTRRVANERDRNGGVLNNHVILSYHLKVNVHRISS